MIDDGSEQEWIDAAAAKCRVCPLCGDHPCPACLAGGVCDDSTCTCYDPEDSDDQWEMQEDDT